MSMGTHSRWILKTHILLHFPSFFLQYYIVNIDCLKYEYEHWRDGSELKSICCLCGRDRVHSQHPHGSLQLPVTLVPGVLTPSSHILRPGHANTHTYRIIKLHLLRKNIDKGLRK